MKKAILVVLVIGSMTVFAFAADKEQPYSDIEIVKQPEQTFMGPSGEQAQSSKVTIGPGMEMRKVGSMNFVVPQGMKVYKDKTGLVKYEDMGEFLARNFDEIRQRQQKIEERQDYLTDELARLQQAFDKQRKDDAAKGQRIAQ
jgi:hypothetical protein